MEAILSKPVIGFSCGDLNGIGIELIIKMLSNTKVLDFCTPVIFCNNKAINFYKKTIGDTSFSYVLLKDTNKLNTKQVNLYNCWEEEVNITPGKIDDTIGKYAFLSLQKAVEALKEKWIDGLITLPIHKKTIQSDLFNYTGHTPFLKEAFEAKEVLMILAAENMKVAVVTEHVPIQDVVKHLSKEIILQKILLLNESLERDFNIQRPKIAILGLNPHAGDDGVIGNEEKTMIMPAIQQAKEKGILCFGPYSADAFFARAMYERFDAVLAMYHDQGLIPFKSLALDGGVNFSAGLSIVRTSPDHGTAFDIAGKNKANLTSSFAALFSCIDIIRNRKNYDDCRKNAMVKTSAKIIATTDDEKIVDEE